MEATIQRPDEDIKTKLERTRKEVQAIKETRNAIKEMYEKEAAYYADQISAILEQLEEHSANHTELVDRMNNTEVRCTELKTKCDEISQQIVEKGVEVEGRVREGREKIDGLVSKW